MIERPNLAPGHAHSSGDRHTEEFHRKHLVSQHALRKLGNKQVD